MGFILQQWFDILANMLIRFLAKSSMVTLANQSSHLTVKQEKKKQNTFSKMLNYSFSFKAFLEEIE